MPKQWVSRTFGTCVPGIQAASLRRQPVDRAISGSCPRRTETVDAHLILATVLSTRPVTSFVVIRRCPPCGWASADRRIW